MGIGAFDEFLKTLAELSGRPIPATICAERGRAVDAATDAHPYFHGRRISVFGDPDPLLGLVNIPLPDPSALPRRTAPSATSFRALLFSRT